MLVEQSWAVWMDNVPLVVSPPRSDPSQHWLCEFWLQHILISPSSESLALTATAAIWAQRSQQVSYSHCHQGFQSLLRDTHNTFATAQLEWEENSSTNMYI